MIATTLFYPISFFVDSFYTGYIEKTVFSTNRKNSEKWQILSLPIHALAILSHIQQFGDKSAVPSTVLLPTAVAEQIICVYDSR